MRLNLLEKGNIQLDTRRFVVFNKSTPLGDGFRRLGSLYSNGLAALVLEPLGWRTDSRDSRDTGPS